MYPCFCGSSYYILTEANGYLHENADVRVSLTSRTVGSLVAFLATCM
jgi:hypothetical protein